MVWTEILASSLPAGWRDLKGRLHHVGDSTYVLFIVDKDSTTGQPWCPDVRAALPVLKRVFEPLEQEVFVVSVGSRAEWRTRPNIFQTNWSLKAVPTLIKYTRTAEGVSQSQLVEEDCKDEEKVKALIQ